MPDLRQPKKTLSPRRIIQVSLVLAVLFLGIFIYLDLAGYMPDSGMKTFPAPWNDIVVYILIILASLVACGLGIRLTRQLEPGDPSRLVWLMFSIGWGFWALGEISGTLYQQFFQTLPDITLTDLFWTAGYISFWISLFYQYRLIYARRKEIGLRIFILVAILVLIITLGITVLARQTGFGEDTSWLGGYLFIFYPVCDLGIGLAALWLSFLYGRGRWGRPWWGLLAFAVSDGISTWYWMGGYQTLTPSMDTWLSLFTDVLYIGGYMLVALACLSNLFLLRHGIAWQPRTDSSNSILR